MKSLVSHSSLFVSLVVSLVIGLSFANPLKAQSTPPTKPTEKVSVEMVGSGDLNESDLRKLLREKRALPTAGSRLDSEAESKIIAGIKEALADRGYMNPVIELHRNETATIRILINEGPRFPIAAIRFEGNKIFSTTELSAKTTKCLERYEPNKEGYDVDTFGFCLGETLDFVRRSGHLRASIGAARREFDGEGVLLTVPVDEGGLYRLGDIKIHGANHRSADQIRVLFPARRGDIANGTAIGKWLYQDVRQIYAEAGYIQFTAELEPEFKEARGKNEGIVDLVVTIDEGPQFRVKKIDFSGADLPREYLRELLVIREGEVYNRKLLEEGIARINKLELFQPIDADRDADFQTNEEEALLEIVVKLKKRVDPAP